MTCWTVRPQFDLGLNSNPIIVGGAGLRFTDSDGTPFTAAYVDSIGQPVADLTSDIAAEGRAKIVYERLIKPATTLVPATPSTSS